MCVDVPGSPTVLMLCVWTAPGSPTVLMLCVWTAPALPQSSCCVCGRAWLSQSSRCVCGRAWFSHRPHVVSACGAVQVKSRVLHNKDIHFVNAQPCDTPSVEGKPALQRRSPKGCYMQVFLCCPNLEFFFFLSPPQPFPPCLQN